MTPGNSSTRFIDEEMYRASILQLPDTLTEDDIDERLERQVQDLGLLPPQVSADAAGISSSLSASTIASDSNKQASILSQSTAPTSCSSSEHRPLTQSSVASQRSASISEVPSIFSEVEKRRSSGFRIGIRKMATFKKRRSVAPSSATLTKINNDRNETHDSDHVSLKSGLKSPGSIKSSKSSWSNAVSATKSSYEQPSVSDPEAVRRGLECKEMLDLRTVQLQERERFIEFQQTLITQLRATRDAIISEKREQHQSIIDERHAKVS